MSTGNQSGVLVVCDRRGSDAERAEAFLRTAGSAAARWCAPRDMNEAEQAVRDGGVRQVVFARLADLLEGLWNGELAPAEWLGLGVRITILDAPGADVLACVTDVCTGWQRHHRARRWRQAVAGLILSALAIAAAFALNWLPAR